MSHSRAEIVVDLGALRRNVARLREHVGVATMTVVKADGYGHGMVEVARAARQAGTAWLGVATLDEATALREAGDTGRLLTWLRVPDEDAAPAIAADVDVTAYSRDDLAELDAAVSRAGRPARLQLKVDTGLSRGGSPMRDWAALVAAAREGEVAGRWRVTGVWSHLACSDEPGHAANDAQETLFVEALTVAESAGLRPEVRHLANSAAGLLRPSARFDLVRFGLASYGLDPAPGHTPDLGLVPAMTVRAELAMVKDVAAGAGVSYGHTWLAPRPTTLGLVPAGYGDGIPRHASNAAKVSVGGHRSPIRGRVCMDQFVVELRPEVGLLDPHARPGRGDEVLLFGPGHHGEPTAQEWAEASGTISYEIVTRIGGRIPRRFVDGADTPTSDTTSGTTTGTTTSTTTPPHRGA